MVLRISLTRVAQTQLIRTPNRVEALRLFNLICSFIDLLQDVRSVSIVAQQNRKLQLLVSSGRIARAVLSFRGFALKEEACRGGDLCFCILCSETSGF